MNPATMIKKDIPGGNGSVFLRRNQFDEDIFKSIFIEKEYAHICFLTEPRTIIDAGANIGLASVFYAELFPNAKIFSIEPAADNFEMLKLNSAAYPNITPIQGALMGTDGRGSLIDQSGSTLGYQVSADPGSGGIVCYSIPTICERYGISHIDLLKMDIEGAEKDVFASASAWVKTVDTLVIELHDRYVKGCNKTVFDATNGMFDLEWIGGENYYFSKRGIASPHVPESFKGENPQKLPVEISWDYRDKYDNLHTEICSEKDAQLNAVQAERDKLSEQFGKMSAEKDAQLNAVQTERDKLSEQFGKMSAEKDAQLNALQAERDKLSEQFGKMSGEKDAQLNALQAERDKLSEQFGKMSGEKDAQLNTLQAECDKLSEQFGKMSGEKDAQLNALQAERDKLSEQFGKMSAEKDAQLNALQAERDKLSELFSAVCAEKDKQLNDLQRQRDELYEKGQNCSEAERQIRLLEEERDSFIKQFEAVCAQKDAQLDAVQKALDDLSERFGVVCAEKDAAIEAERAEKEAQLSELVSACELRDSRMVDMQRTINEYSEKYATPGKAIKTALSDALSPKKRRAPGSAPKGKTKKTMLFILALFVIWASFVGVYFAQNARRSKIAQESEPAAVQQTDTTVIQETDAGKNLIASFEFHDQGTEYYLEGVIGLPGESCDNQIVNLLLTDSEGNDISFECEQIDRADWAELVGYPKEFKMGGFALHLPTEQLKHSEEYSLKISRENEGHVLVTSDVWHFSTPEG